MKKLFLSIIALTAAISVMAQNNPIETYPNTKGDVIVNKCYDAEGNLHGTMKYTISNSNVSDMNSHLEIVFVMTNAKNEVIDYGTIYANYENDNFNIRMSNRPTIDHIDSYLSLNTKMMNDFLDYPNTFANDPFNTSPFRLEAADYTIKTGEKNNDHINVKVHGRELIGNEKITTPAGEFDAYKITFALDVYDSNTKQTKEYKGTEWYSVGKGVVRTEITDAKGGMVDYSEIAELHVK